MELRTSIFTIITYSYIKIKFLENTQISRCGITDKKFLIHDKVNIIQEEVVFKIHWTHIRISGENQATLWLNPMNQNLNHTLVR